MNRFFYAYIGLFILLVANIAAAQQSVLRPDYSGGNLLIYESYPPNSEEIINSAADEWILHENSKFTLSVPFNSEWGTENYSINPYEIYDSRIYFGPIGFADGGGIARHYYFEILDEKPNDFLSQIEANPDNNQSIEYSSVNDWQIIRIQESGFCEQNAWYLLTDINVYKFADNCRVNVELFDDMISRFEIEHSFSDVSVTHTYADAISYVRDENIVSGYPDGTYRPDNPINRAEFTKIVVNAALDPSLLTKNQECFPDVTTTDWFAPFVCTAKEQGIISGYPDGEFKASGNINAAEAFKIVAEAFGMALPETGEQDEWYQRYWATMQDHEAIPATITKPDQLLTRGEMAAVIWMVMNSNER